MEPRHFSVASRRESYQPNSHHLAGGMSADVAQSACKVDQPANEAILSLQRRSLTQGAQASFDAIVNQGYESRLPPLTQYYGVAAQPASGQPWQHSYQPAHPAYLHQAMPSNPAAAFPISGYAPGSYGQQQDHECMVGKPGYPEPVREKVHKSRFTADDDRLLRHLKEDFADPKLSWKQIADFFPGRKSGTLQVRYCTKVKPKNEPPWTDEAKERLWTIMNEVSSEYWSIVAERLRTGASAQSCEEVGSALREEKKEGNSDGPD